MKVLRNQKGITLVEILLAMFATGLITAAGFQFYVQMHNSAISQEQVSDMQLSSRASLEEICKTLRMAGFKVDESHPAYAINGESLYVFTNISQPVDTILYFLQDYTNIELDILGSPPIELRPRKLMIQVNSGTPEIFADNIRTLRFRAISSSAVEVALTVQTLKADEKYADNKGYRMQTAMERIKLRNLDI